MLIKSDADLTIDVLYIVYNPLSKIEEYSSQSVIIDNNANNTSSYA